MESTDELGEKEKQVNELRKRQVRELGTLKLQGKDYLQVAHRVLIFRTDHPTASIRTSFEPVGEFLVARAEVISADGDLWSTAIKSVQPGGKGPAAKYPLEMAETGAIGRALGLCGYGTLSGDLDEGDQIADAPQDTKRKW